MSFRKAGTLVALGKHGLAIRRGIPAMILLLLSSCSAPRAEAIKGDLASTLASGRASGNGVIALFADPIQNGFHRISVVRVDEQSH